MDGFFELFLIGFLFFGNLAFAVPGLYRITMAGWDVVYSEANPSGLLSHAWMLIFSFLWLGMVMFMGYKFAGERLLATMLLLECVIFVVGAFAMPYISKENYDPLAYWPHLIGGVMFALIAAVVFTLKLVNPLFLIDSIGLTSASKVITYFTPTALILFVSAAVRYQLKGSRQPAEYPES